MAAVLLHYYVCSEQTRGREAPTRAARATGPNRNIMLGEGGWGGSEGGLHPAQDRQAQGEGGRGEREETYIVLTDGRKTNNICRGLA